MAAGGATTGHGIPLAAGDDGDALAPRPDHAAYPEEKRVLAYRSQGGTQWHILDPFGCSWCGLLPGSLYVRESQRWLDTPDQDKCQTCRRIAPIPLILVRRRKDRTLSERVVTPPGPKRVRPGARSWAYRDRSTSPQSSWGGLETGNATPDPPDSGPGERVLF